MHFLRRRFDGDVSGIDNSTFNPTAGTIQVDPSKYDGLKINEFVRLEIEYVVNEGGADGDLATLADNTALVLTATVTIEGVNDAPTSSTPIDPETFIEDDPAGQTVDLIPADYADVDLGDTAAVSLITIDGDPGNAVAIVGNNAVIDPTVYDGLQTGETVNIYIDYDVIDAAGDGIGKQTAHIQIVGVNDNPVGPAPLISGFDEDAANPQSLDLLAGATDPDGDELTVLNLDASGDLRGVTLTGSSVEVDPTAYNSLSVGETVDVVFDYVISDRGLDPTVVPPAAPVRTAIPQSATITITGVNDPVDLGPALSQSANEEDPVFEINLLAGTQDQDANDILIVTNPDFGTPSTDPNGGVTIVGTTAVVDPNAYNELTTGESQIITLVYDIDDQNGSVVTQTATITIEGFNDAPSVTPLAITLTENDLPVALDLLQGAADPEGDLIAAINRTTLDQATETDPLGAVTIPNINSARVQPDQYDSLGAGDTKEILLSYEVQDNGAPQQETPQTYTITITGLNDAPVVPVQEVGFDEDSGVQTVDLLATATDADAGETASLQIQNLAINGNIVGVEMDPGATTLTIDTSKYDDLSIIDLNIPLIPPFPETETITFTYDVVDSAGAVVPGTTEVEITAVNDAPYANITPLEVTYTDVETPSGFDLLSAAFDRDDFDFLRVQNFQITSYTIEGVAQGGTPAEAINWSPLTGAELGVEPFRFADEVSDGEVAVVTADYEIVDLNGEVSNQQIVIRVLGTDLDPNDITSPLLAGNSPIIQVAGLNQDAAVGLAFSPLDFNMWHPTTLRGGDAGHGINAAPDDTRAAVEGGTSFYFGFENFVESRDENTRAYLTDLDGDGADDNGANAQYGVLTTEFQSDLASNPLIVNNYNVPGGGYGSIETKAFSLTNESNDITVDDRPTLYFNYFLDTEDHVGGADPDNPFRDSARVFISDNGGPWELAVTNNSPLSVESVEGDPPPPPAELPGFLSHLSDSALNRETPTPERQQLRQEMFDSTGVWRQARVDLSTYAGKENLRIRIDFSSAGQMPESYGSLAGDEDNINGNFGELTNAERSIRSLDNDREGFFVDDFIIGYAETWRDGDRCGC